jgi:hypothetical protein
MKLFALLTLVVSLVLVGCSGGEGGGGGATNPPASTNK